MHRRRQMRREVERAVDEREMCECLREVPEQALRARVVLLGYESEIIRQSGETLEQLDCFVVAAE